MKIKCPRCNSENIKYEYGWKICHDCGWVEEKYYIDKEGRVLK